MSALPAPFTAAHRSYVKSLYRRILTNELNWIVRRDLWRAKALAIRAEFERNRDIHDPRALAEILAKAEADLAKRKHPDPVRGPTAPDGSGTYLPLYALTSRGQNMTIFLTTDMFAVLSTAFALQLTSDLRKV
ncbi:hypothetical protein NM688_g4524 [Phlebia brevispora]|uniref:Uncharacterized protein n=1 Tax=Phlebia brevispora TaxID=194682 RepID=A0ACC1T2U5_9APHY|nr:hypothetical protein NM688_g4524 [Phlebia brevispora]